METTLETAMRERVEKGAAFLDKHYPGWWEHIDLGTLEISSCTTCVLGQVYDMAPPIEQGQIIFQAVAYLKDRSFTDEQAQSHVETDNNFSRMTMALEELRGSGASDLGFAWDSFSQDRQEPVLTEAWTRLIIQRRLAAHPDVTTEFSKLDEIEKELVAV